MEEDGLVADDGEELKDHKDTGGDDRGEVEGYSNSVDAGLVPVPFTCDGAGFEGGGGVAANVEVGDAGEGEAEHGAAKDEDWVISGCISEGVERTHKGGSCSLS